MIVTGAASGIGFSCVEALLAAGHCVCATDLQQFPAERLQPDPSRFAEVRADIADEAELPQGRGACRRGFGTPNALIHMAALHSTLTWRELTSEHIDRILAVNVTGSFLMARAVAEHMTEGGAMVLTSSGSIAVGGVGGRGRAGRLTWPRKPQSSVSRVRSLAPSLRFAFASTQSALAQPKRP